MILKPSLSFERYFPMRLRLALFVFAILLGFPSLGVCEMKCPWLNVATASGLLGGEARLTVNSPVPMVDHPRSPMYEDATKRMDEPDVSCKFSYQDPSSSNASTLLIQVKTLKDTSKEYPLYLSNCTGPRVPLKGIGNEAVFCPISASEGVPKVLRETVVGRVRNRGFILMVDRPAALAAVASQDGLSDDTRNIAEQVAGTIF